jgi:hypothetical protein
MVKRNVDDFKEREDDEIAKGVDKIMNIIDNKETVNTKVSKTVCGPKTKKPRLKIARVEGQVLSYGIDEDVVTMYSAEGEHLNVNKNAIDDVVEELKELKEVVK